MHPLAKKALLFAEHNLPITRWLPRYRLKDLSGDVIASLALAALAAPEAISYASIAGVRPGNGLYAAFLAPIIYSVFGSSPQLVTGPTTVMSLLTRASVPDSWAGVPLVPETDLYISICALLALVAGLIQLTLAILRAGFLARLISSPVIVGFCVGSSLVIASTQFATLVGAPRCVGASGGSCTVIEAIKNVSDAGRAGKLGWGVPVAALVCLFFLFSWKFGLPRVLPKQLKVVANAGPLCLMIITCALMGNPDIGAALKKQGITTAEAIPAGLPSPSPPFPSDELTGGSYPSSSDISGLLASAMPLAIIGFVESLTIAKTTSRLFGPYPIDVNQELLAVGASNIGVALLQGYPVTGSFSRTAVNAASGARSPLSSGLAGLALLVVILALTGPLSYLPKVASAAIVIVAISKLLDFPELARIFRSDKRDFVVAFITFSIIVFAGSVPSGLIAGVALQWLFGLTRGFAVESEVALWKGRLTAFVSSSTTSGSSDVLVKWTKILPGLALDDEDASSSATSAKDPTLTGPASFVSVCSLRFEPDLQFAEAARLSAHIAETYSCYNPSALVIDASGVSGIDSTGAAHVCDEAEDAAVQTKRLFVRTGASPSSVPIAVTIPSVLIIGGCNRQVLKKLLKTSASRGLPISTADITIPTSHGSPANHQKHNLLSVGPLLVAETPQAALLAAQELVSQRIQERLEAKLAKRANRGSASVAIGGRYTEASDGLGNMDDDDDDNAPRLNISGGERLEGIPPSTLTKEAQLRRRNREPFMKSVLHESLGEESTAASSTGVIAATGSAKVVANPAYRLGALAGSPAALAADAAAASSDEATDGTPGPIMPMQSHQAPLRREESVSEELGDWDKDWSSYQKRAIIQAAAEAARAAGSASSASSHASSAKLVPTASHIAGFYGGAQGGVPGAPASSGSPGNIIAPSLTSYLPSPPALYFRRVHASVAGLQVIRSGGAVEAVDLNGNVSSTTSMTGFGMGVELSRPSYKTVSHGVGGGGPPRIDSTGNLQKSLLGDVSSSEENSPVMKGQGQGPLTTPPGAMIMGGGSSAASGAIGLEETPFSLASPASSPSGPATLTSPVSSSTSSSVIASPLHALAKAAAANNSTAEAGGLSRGASSDSGSGGSRTSRASVAMAPPPSPSSASAVGARKLLGAKSMKDVKNALTPRPLHWLHPAVAAAPSTPVMGKRQSSAIIADSSAAAVVTGPSSASASASGPSASCARCDVGGAICGCCSATAHGATSLCLKPIHAASEAFNGIRRIARVIAETEPFLQPS